MEEFDQPHLGGKAGARIVAGLAKLNHAGIADRRCEQFEIAEIIISRVDRSDRDRVRGKPGLERVGRLRGGRGREPRYREKRRGAGPCEQAASGESWRRRVHQERVSKTARSDKRSFLAT